MQLILFNWLSLAQRDDLTVPPPCDVLLGHGWCCRIPDMAEPALQGEEHSSLGDTDQALSHTGSE